VGIVDEDIAKVKEQTDFVAIVSEHVQLRRVGRRWSGLCPFHAEKTPSFSVNGEEGLYHCFGCQASGDAISFVQELLHLDFRSAVEHLASRASISLRYDDGAAADQHRKRRSRLVAVMEEAVQWYHERLLTAADAAQARAYIRGRGYDGDVVREYRLGYAPDGFDALSRALKKSDHDMIGAGLAFINKRRQQQDVFRDRVLFPIFDANGDAVAFGGRRLSDGDGPKYKNSSENDLYRKSKVLYGLNWAKAHAVKAGEVVICEGYTDVIGFARAGVPWAVATCGTSLTDEHVRLLVRFARRFVLAYDADSAGQAAAERVHAWEHEHELDVAVAALPPGRDPADVARDDPERLASAVEDAQPFLEFRVRRVLEGADLSTAEGRAKAAESAVAVVAGHHSPLVRDQYLMEIGDRCRLDVAQLRPVLEEARRRPDRPAPSATTQRNPAASRRSERDPSSRGDDAPGMEWGPDEMPSDATAGPPPPAPIGKAEAEALRLLISEPDHVPSFDELLFGDELSAAAFRALEETGGAATAIEIADPGAAALLHRLAVEDATAEVDDVRRVLAIDTCRRAIGEAQREARASDDPQAWAEVIRWLGLTLEHLLGDDEDGVGDTVVQLIEWLHERDAA
jgi:DNA primase